MTDKELLSELFRVSDIQRVIDADAGRLCITQLDDNEKRALKDWQTLEKVAKETYKKGVSNE